MMQVEKCGERPAAIATAQTRFIVRMPGASYAFHFHTNACGRHAQAVADRDASVYGSRAEAEAEAHKHGLRDGQFEISEWPANGRES